MRDIRPLESARWKVDHAKWHINRMNGLVQDYLDSEPCGVVLSSRLHVGDRYFILQVDPVPRDIQLALGDALGSMRASLDHVAWALSNGRGDDSTKFAITGPERATVNPKRAKGQARKKVATGRGVLKHGPSCKGFSSEAKHFVVRHNPAQGDANWADHPLPLLSVLVNADKHKMIRAIGGYAGEIALVVDNVSIKGGGRISGGGKFVTELPEGAQMLKNGAKLNHFAFQAGAEVDYSVEAEAPIEIRLEDRPTEEIRIMLGRIHEAVELIVTEAERDWEKLVPPRN